VRAGIWLDQVDSTLDELHARAAAGAPDGTWLVAAEQRAGRGSRGRSWHSGRGGLWLSVLRRGAGTPAGFELLSLRAGLAVASVLDGLPPVAPVMLKWPNDLMVRDRKVGGLLAEARWQGERLQWVAIGLGLNVKNPIPDELVGLATSLGDYCGETTVEALAEPLASALGGTDLEAPRLTSDELAEFAARDWLRGRAVSSPVRGTAAGLGADGRLAVRDPSGVVHRVSRGDVLQA
jgi:BirA family transcriptional regulator, biotin operon repressor / biotin---[acetyl-CoA-carboxylase] ligase